MAALGSNSLSIYPQVGLIIFLAVFVAVTVRALRRSKSDVNRWAHIPLDDTTEPAAPAASPEGSTKP